MSTQSSAFSTDRPRMSPVARTLLYAAGLVLMFLALGVVTLHMVASGLGATLPAAM